MIAIPAGSTATLSYFLKMANLTAPANSTLTVSVGGATVQTINEPATNDADYVLRLLDLSAFADGVPRVLSFNYSRPGGGAASDTYTLDDVAVGINCGQPMASISGRVLTPAGLGIQNVIVALTDSNGVRRIATTSSFGLFSFDSVATGQAYVLGARSRRYRFPAKSIVVTVNMANVEFWGLQ